MWGTDANNIWAVGDYDTVIKWNGTAWALQPSGEGISQLLGIWGTTTTNFWLVGGGAILHKVQ